MGETGLVALAEGAVFQGRYRVVRAMKNGGMGALYEVVHLETRRRRALKVMLPELATDPDMRARFRQEATATADVDSQHVVETFDAGVDDETGAPFLVMELLQGEDLAAASKRRGRLPANEVVTLLRQVAMALDRVHAVGVVHRDLKPSNLFLTKRDDGSPHVKVLDFGIAKMVAQSTASARTTRSLGTPVYMSPEQIRGDGRIGPAADLHALGHIAYALLVGRPYWDAEARAAEAVYPLLVEMMRGAPETATKRAARDGVTLPAAFDAWFERATAPAPEDRFADASELVEALAAAVGEAPHAAQSSARVPESRPATPAASRAGRRRPISVRHAIAAMAAIIIALAIAAVWTRSPAPPSSSAAASANPSTNTPSQAPELPAAPPTTSATPAMDPAAISTRPRARTAPASSVRAPTPAATTLPDDPSDRR